MVPGVMPTATEARRRGGRGKGQPAPSATVPAAKKTKPAAVKPARAGQPAKLADLAPNPRNPRKPWRDDAQRDAFRRSLAEFGDLSGIVFNRTTGQLVGGHKRVDEFREDAGAVLAVTEKLAKPDAAGTVAHGHVTLSAGTRFSYREVVWPAAKEAAANLAANKWGAEFDLEGVGDLLGEAREGGFDLELTGFGLAEVGSLLDSGVGKGDGAVHVLLSEKFGAPPFSVLDTRQGYWQERRALWRKLTGNLSETKEQVLGRNSKLGDINDGSSNFDPVLAELVMRWFCPKGGKVLDPFGGEQTKGVVAGVLGLSYHAVELRKAQVDVDRKACRAWPSVKYFCGDSEDIGTIVKERGFDLCFTSPPYYDLEVYSKADMSAMGTYSGFMAKYRKIFARCVDMLAKDAFLIVKVGEIRDKKTGIYRNFVGDNIALFSSLGLQYYNEIILLNSCGTAPARAQKLFASRKVVKVHQNVLVFVKGNAAKAAARCGEVEAYEIPAGR